MRGVKVEVEGRREEGGRVRVHVRSFIIIHKLCIMNIIMLCCVVFCVLSHVMPNNEYMY